MPAGKTQKIPELPTQHISIQNRKLNRSHLTVLEKLLWKTRQKAHKHFRAKGILPPVLPWENCTMILRLALFLQKKIKGPKDSELQQSLY